MDRPGRMMVDSNAPGGSQPPSAGQDVLDQVPSLVEFWQRNTRLPGLAVGTLLAEPARTELRRR